MGIQNVVILGSTGSVGKSTVEVLLAEKPARFSVSLLAAAGSWPALLAQAKSLGTSCLYLDKPEAFKQAKKTLSRKTKLLQSRGDLLGFLSSEPIDIAVVVLSDFELAALTIEALCLRSDRRIKILVASKEPMVTFGDAYRRLASKNAHAIIPLDSEPSAIFQCLNGSLDTKGSVDKIYLTATGGPFYRKPVPWDKITPEMALNHPVWKMGKKITIDSATLVNKALELMEINNLFNMPSSKIEILIHPQCVIHSMVAMKNGSILAQLGPATMKLPIHYGLLWPQGFDANGVVNHIGPQDLAQLTFDKPDFERFPCLKIALDVAKVQKEPQRLIARAALMGADEAAVESFLAGRIGFQDMPGLLRETVAAASRHWASLKAKRQSDLKFGLSVFKWAKETALRERVKQS